MAQMDGVAKVIIRAADKVGRQHRCDHYNGCAGRAACHPLDHHAAERRVAHARISAGGGAHQVVAVDDQLVVERHQVCVRAAQQAGRRRGQVAHLGNAALRRQAADAGRPTSAAAWLR